MSTKGSVQSDGPSCISLTSRSGAGRRCSCGRASPRGGGWGSPGTPCSCWPPQDGPASECGRWRRKAPIWDTLKMHGNFVTNWKLQVNQSPSEAALKFPTFILQSGVSGCEKGLLSVFCNFPFLTQQPVQWNSQKTVNKTFFTTWRPGLYADYVQDHKLLVHYLLSISRRLLKTKLGA